MCSTHTPRRVSARGLAWELWLGATPTFSFVTVQVATHKLDLSISLAAIVLTVATAVQVAIRRQFKTALAGAAVLLIGFALAFLSREPRDVFLPGILISGVGALVGLVSTVAGVPIVGIAYSLATGKKVRTWRSNKMLRRRFQLITLCVSLGSALRSCVQYYFYLSGELTLLGQTRAILGVPLYAVTFLICWRIWPADQQLAYPNCTNGTRRRELHNVQLGAHREYSEAHRDGHRRSRGTPKERI